jgi:5,10-methylenetetrahydrofolate reductase
VSDLAHKFEQGQFVITGELTPPKGTDTAGMRARAELLAPCIDAFNITDSHASKMSLSPIAAARLLLEDGVEPILQMTTRDRNRIALQSDMLGAWVLGVKNLVCMGGDPPHLGDHPQAKPVFDINAEELITAANKLNAGRDLMDNPLNQATGFTIGAVVNPGAEDLDFEIARLEAKAAAGARFFQTQAVFDAGHFGRFMARVQHLEVKILAGVMPIKSLAMARFMNEKIPGIDIPEALLKRIEEAGDVAGESTLISAEIIRAIQPLCHGLHIMAPGWEDRVPDLLRRAGLAG